MKKIGILYWLLPGLLLAQNTQDRNDAGASGVGISSGFYQTVNPVNFPEGATSWWHLLDIRHTNVNNNYAMQLSGSFFDQDLWFRKTSNSASQAWRKVIAENSEGYVGIGIINPQAKLDVDGMTMSGGHAANLDFALYPTRLIGLKNTGKMGVGWNLSGGLGEVDLISNRGEGSTGGFHFYDYTNAGERKRLLVLNSNGNASLDGKLEAKEIKVTNTPTADFVFEEDYPLPDLASVEQHIKEKKHLPEIASASEMEKEGVNIGDFQIKLLQKIEELTLYSIEQNKELQRQKAFKRLESKISGLENR